MDNAAPVERGDKIDPASTGPFHGDPGKGKKPLCLLGGYDRFDL